MNIKYRFCSTFHKNIKENTSLDALGIIGLSPKDEAIKLANKIAQGIENLTDSDIDYLSNSIFTRINGTSLDSFRLAESIVKRAGLGLAWRLDAAKDIVDQDAGRNGEIAFEDNWQSLINFWGKLISNIKKENPISISFVKIFVDYRKKDFQKPLLK